MRKYRSKKLSTETQEDLQIKRTKRNAYMSQYREKKRDTEIEDRQNRTTGTDLYMKQNKFSNETCQDKRVKSTKKGFS